MQFSLWKRVRDEPLRLSTQHLSRDQWQGIQHGFRGGRRKVSGDQAAIEVSCISRVGEQAKKPLLLPLREPISIEGLSLLKLYEMSVHGRPTQSAEKDRPHHSRQHSTQDTGSALALSRIDKRTILDLHPGIRCGHESEIDRTDASRKTDRCATWTVSIP